MVRLVSSTFNIIGGLVAASATQGYAGDIGVAFEASPSGARPGCSIDVAWIINGQASLGCLINGPFMRKAAREVARVHDADSAPCSSQENSGAIRIVSRAS
jgi:hypothetical protein